MSTILKALRKLEAQSQPPPEVDRPRVWRRRVPGTTATFGLPGVAWVLAITALVASVAIFSWLRWQGQGQTVPADTGQPVGAPSPSPATMPAAPRPLQATATPETSPALPEATPPPTTSADTPIRQPLSHPQRIPADQALASVARQPPAATAAPTAPPDNNSAGATRPRVTIQAIAWSTAPVRRIVVIDGHVLHEGDGVGRIRVTRIDKNHVTLTENGKSWSVKFGR